MIRRASLLVLLILTFSSLAPRTISNAQEAASEGTPAAEIAAVLKMQQAAWNDGNIRGFMNGYWNSPALTFSGSSGISRGWQSVFENYQKRYGDRGAMGHLEFSELEVRVVGGSSALVLGKWHLTRATGELGGVFTLVFEKFPEGWRIIHDHTSQVSL